MDAVERDFTKYRIKMNTIPFKAKNEILFVEVPRNSFDFLIEPNRGYISATEPTLLFGYKDWFSDKLPSGTWQILNLSNSLSESDMELVCKPVNDNVFNGLAYTDYMSTSICDTVSESYASLKQHLGIIDENPFGEKPVKPNGFDFESSHEYKCALFKYKGNLIAWNQYENEKKSYLVIVKTD